MTSASPSAMSTGKALAVPRLHGEPHVFLD